jgi:hypothetical protein
MNQVELKRTNDNPQLNERLWQAWVCKNRQMERAATVKGWRILKVAAAIGLLAVIVYSLIR